MRLSVLDVGSNTVHLLLLDVTPGSRPEPYASHKMPLQLVQHLTEDGDISEKGRDLLTSFVAEARAAYGLPAPVALGFSNGANIAAAMLLKPRLEALGFSPFVKTTGGNRVLDATSLERAYRLVGLKGYVSNIPIEMMPAREVIADYHALWQVEASFRMSKTDLRARPIFSHSREAIEAHLTIVFAALAISRYLQQRTGSSIRHIVRTLRPLQHVTINIAGQPVIAEPQIPAEAQRLLDALTH